MSKKKGKPDKPPGKPDKPPGKPEPPDPIPPDPEPIPPDPPIDASTPELPRVYFDTTYTPPTGRTIQTSDVQNALDSAQPGDEILIN